MKYVWQKIPKFFRLYVVYTSNVNTMLIVFVYIYNLLQFYRVLICIKINYRALICIKIKIKKILSGIHTLFNTREFVYCVNVTCGLPVLFYFCTENSHTFFFPLLCLFLLNYRVISFLLLLILKFDFN